MNILQLLSTTLCGALVWIFIVPSRHCPNRRYRILFWIFFVILLLAASVIASAISIHDKWYTQGIAVIICAIISAYTSIQIAPNNYTTATPPINIDDLKYALNNGEHRNRPYFALQITKYYLGKDYEQAVKYASLTIQMLDSLSPKDLIGEYKQVIATNKEFCVHAYLNVTQDKYKSDQEYMCALNGYRSQQSNRANKISNKVDAERIKIKENLRI